MRREDRSKGDHLAYSIREEMGDCMPIDIWYEGNVWVFRPFGRIDAGHSVDLDAALTEGIAQGMRLMVVDLTDTSYISSSGLRALIKSAKAVKGSGGSISVCGMNDLVKEIFEVSGLLNIFGAYPTVKEAVAEMQRKD